MEIQVSPCGRVSAVCPQSTASFPIALVSLKLINHSLPVPISSLFLVMVMCIFPKKQTFKNNL